MSTESKEFIVSYDLRYAKNDSPDYSKLIEHLESYDYHCRIQKSVWIITYSGDRISLYDNIIEYICKDDSLFVSDYTASTNHHGESDFENCFSKRKGVTNYVTKNEFGSKLS